MTIHSIFIPSVFPDECISGLDSKIKQAFHLRKTFTYKNKKLK